MAFSDNFYLVVAMAKKKINVEGFEITILVGDKADYISLTDIAKQSADEPRFTIRSWMRNNSTLAYLDEWESVHNPDFKRGEAASATRSLAAVKPLQILLNI
ncbi:MAG: KilA-N domain-containing protein [Lewinellaceae bacterium]|nr:KilA-N domain-containing protein [Phaeodactylibacter sp.]MCB9041155.1 KilA-N domain-containing protein [Lewinellaceae bacterium]